MQDVCIRHANLEDAAPLSALARMAFCETFQHYDPQALADFLSTHCSKQAFEKALVAEDITILVATIGETYVGYAKFGASRLPEMPGVVPAFELHQLYVLKVWHGRKIGAQLMERVIAAGRKHNVQAMHLGVWEHNLRAQAFYERYGFTRVGSYEYLPIGDVVDQEWIMEKSLVS